MAYGNCTRQVPCPADCLRPDTEAFVKVADGGADTRDGALEDDSLRSPAVNHGCHVVIDSKLTQPRSCT